MSLDATRWAWEQPVRSVAQRSVLLAMADLCRRRSAVSFPSRERLHAMTLLDLKTISATTHELAALGLIRDTGERRGKSGRIVVYELLLDGIDAPKNGTIKTAEIGEKRNDSPCPVDNSAAQAGAGAAMEPNFPADATVFGGECTQKRNDLIVPKTEHRTGVNLEPGFEPGTTSRSVATAAPSASLTDAAPEKPREGAHPKPAGSKIAASPDDWWQRTLDEGKAAGLTPEPGERKPDFRRRVNKTVAKASADTAAGA